jgi:predicted nicotinamide N-methyase
VAAFRTRIATADVAGRTWRLRVLRDRQQYDDDSGSAEHAGVPPSGWSHFGQLWPAGIDLANVMGGEDVAGLRVLELGCGIGLPSLVLAERGADVTASDHHPLAARFLRSNARRNGITAPAFRELPWRGDDATLGRFDLIIAADVLYERDHAVLLARMVAQHGLPHGAVLIADPRRGESMHLTRALAALGYGVHVAPASAAAAATAGMGSRMLRYRR